MIDTHAHLDFENFDQDREEVISRFFSQGGKAIINIGVDLATSRKSVELAEKYEEIFAAVGFHPHDAKEILSSASEDDFDELKKITVHEKVRAIGEIGLDYSRYAKPKEIAEQRLLFERQLQIASELRLPVVVHCRDAWDDVYKIISNLKFKISNFQLHCYSGNQEDTEKFLKLPNVHFSFSGNITYPKPVERARQLEEVIKMIPLDRIMLDSDSPYLAPQEFRGRRNEPAYIRYIARKIAEIKGISEEQVEQETDSNARKIFGI